MDTIEYIVVMDNDEVHSFEVSRELDATPVAQAKAFRDKEFPGGKLYVQVTEG